MAIRRVVIPTSEVLAKHQSSIIRFYQNVDKAAWIMQMIPYYLIGVISTDLEKDDLEVMSENMTGAAFIEYLFESLGAMSEPIPGSDNDQIRATMSRIVDDEMLSRLLVDFVDDMGNVIRTYFPVLFWHREGEFVSGVFHESWLNSDLVVTIELFSYGAQYASRNLTASNECVSH